MESAEEVNSFGLADDGGTRAPLTHPSLFQHHCVGGELLVRHTNVRCDGDIEDTASIFYPLR